MNSKNTVTTISTFLASSALALAVIGAQAQGVSTPSSNPSGANLSRSAPYPANAYNINTPNTQNYGVFGGANSNPYGNLGFTNVYGIGVAGGIGSYGGFAGLGGVNPFTSYFGMPLGGFSGGLSGSNISLVGSADYGFSMIGPNGTYFTGLNGAYDPYLNPDGGARPKTQAQSAGANTPASAPGVLPSPSDRVSPEALARSIVIRRGRNYDVSVGWRGDPKLLASMKVTLLNQYHLPLAQQDAVPSAPAYFAAGQDTYTACYYRVEVQYADGAVAAMTGRLTR